MAGEEKPSFSIKDKRGEERPEEDKPSPAPETAGEKPATDKNNKGKAPQITFSTFVLSLSSSAAMSLGGYQDPVSGHVPKNLELAKQSIDILGILAEKTKGNLNDDEQKLLDSSLYELRMRYVEEVKKG
ncbi:MAG: DUF1844 domain-containing protein [Nitrospinota bacterium]